jgi:hypothetical protein
MRQGFKERRHEVHVVAISKAGVALVRRQRGELGQRGKVATKALEKLDDMRCTRQAIAMGRDVQVMPHDADDIMRRVVVRGRVAAGQIGEVARHGVLARHHDADALGLLNRIAEQSRAESKPQFERHVEARQAAGTRRRSREIVDRAVAACDEAA